MRTFAAALTVLICLVASIYLARVTVKVPDRGDRRWYRGATATPARLAATAVVAVVLAALAGWAAGWSALLPAYVALAAVAAPLVVIDHEHHRLPSRLLYPLGAAAAVLLAVAAAVDHAWDDYLRAVEAAAVVYLVLVVLVLISPRSLGMGDVRLGALLAAYLGYCGWLLVYVGLFAGFALAAAAAVALLAARRATRTTALPFGPMLILGALLVLAVNASAPLSG